MNDFNMNAKLPDSAVMNSFVRENSVHPLQSKKNTQTTEVKESTETEKRQEVASQKSPLDFVKDASKEKLDQTVTQLNDSLQNIQRNLEFSIDKEAGRIVINVVDKETDKIVRQIPSEEVLELAKNLHKISEQASDKLEEQINKRNELSPEAANGGVFFKSSV
ncbi:MAG: flagellar protein FlaG [gamma proteobacterium symbiont of Taylorina sp.]|nr:flagellar protein FlaG [gamma proteobacterium symbiont of Taylorina sp.]